jgi:hypothetical protein
MNLSDWTLRVGCCRRSESSPQAGDQARVRFEIGMLAALGVEVRDLPGRAGNRVQT